MYILIHSLLKDYTLRSAAVDCFIVYRTLSVFMNRDPVIVPSPLGASNAFYAFSCSFLLSVLFFFLPIIFFSSCVPPSVPSFLPHCCSLILLDIDTELEALFETAHSNYLQQTAQRTHDFKELTVNDQKLTSDIDKMRKKIETLQTNVQQVRAS